jgi:amino acid efflux transporter
MSADLRKSLTVFTGTALLINIVVGAGLLTLPGLAVKAAGSHAFVAWILAGLVAAPLLLVFVLLGRSVPDAGGLAAYARAAFGPIGQRIASFLFLGAVAFGLPAIALTGGHYAVSIFGGDAGLFAIALVLIALLPHLLPGEGAGKAMGWIASLVVIAIVFFLAVGLIGLPTKTWTDLSIVLPTTLSASAVIAPFMMIFFAFTGWEVGAGSAEEYANPARDYPIAMIASYLIVSVFYLAIAFVAQVTDLTGSFEAPFVAFVRPILGPAGAVGVALLAILIVFANLSGAIWGVSRMVYALARDGLLPRLFANAPGGTPVTAVALTVFSIVGVLLADLVFHFGLDGMLARAGMNFLILYAIAAAALVVISSTLAHRVLGITVILIVAAMLVWAQNSVLYPLALAILAVVASLAANFKRLAGAERGKAD